jgi:hypothetical protein
MNLRKASQALRLAGTCPSCGSEKAYHGFAKVECPTPGCANFSQKQQDEVAPKPKGGWSPQDALREMAQNAKDNEPNQMGEAPGDEECIEWADCTKPHVTCDGCGNRWHDLSYKGRKCPWYNDCGGVIE